MIRVLARIQRRAGLPLYYTEGFSPRPMMSFGPALALGMQSVAEYVDFSLTAEIPPDEIAARMERATEPGLELVGVRRLDPNEPALTKRIDAVDFLAVLPETSGLVDALDRFHALTSLPVTVRRKDKERTVDAKSIVLAAELDVAGRYGDILDVGETRAVLKMRVTETSGRASLKPSELVSAIAGVELPPQAFLRTACLSVGATGKLVDALEAPAPARPVNEPELASFRV
jgi:radical SAM-linked protein